MHCGREVARFIELKGTLHHGEDTLLTTSFYC